MKTVLFTLVLLSTQLLFAQRQLDSLKFLLSKARESNNANQIGVQLSEIGKYFISKNENDSAYFFYQQSLRINKKVGNDTLVASNLNDIGVIFFNRGALDSAINYYTASLKLFNKLNDTIKSAYIEINLSIIYKDKGLWEQGLEYGLSAASKLELLPADYNLSVCYNTIASIYYRINDYSNASLYHHKALNLRKLLKHQRGISMSLNNLGNLFSYINEYDSALHYYQLALTLKRDLKDKKGIATTLNNIGDILKKTGKVEEAIEYYNQSYKLKVEMSDKAGQVVTLNNLAECEMKLKNYNVAKNLLSKASILDKELGGALENQRDNLQIAIQLYAQLKDYKTAWQKSQALIQVKDSLLNIEKAQALAETQVRYETEKKEQHIALLEKEGSLTKAQLEAKQTWILLLIIIVLAVIGLSLMLYYILRQARRNELRIQMLLKELHHRVKNNLQMLSGVLSLQSQQLSKESEIQIVKSNEGRIAAMALIHRKLYQDEQNRSINIKDYINELIQNLVHTYGFNDKPIQLNVAIDDMLVDVDKAIPIGLVLNELITNAFKYAYEGQPNPELNLVLSNIAKNKIEIIVSDNGIGINHDRAKDSSFGLKMVNMLVRDLKGKLKVSSAPGTKYELNIPL